MTTGQLDVREAARALLDVDAFATSREANAGEGRDEGSQDEAGSGEEVA